MQAKQSEFDAAEHRSASLASAASKGVMWLLGQTAASRIVQALSQIVLAWLLAPADFGQVSLALAVTTIVSALFSFGFEDVLLQRHKAIRLWVGTVFRLSLAIGLLGGVALLVAAPVAAWIYQQPSLVGLIAIVALVAPISALETVPGTILRSRLNFRALALASFGEVVGASLLSIALAALGFGPYSFVLPTPIVAAGRVAVLWSMASPTIRNPRRRSGWRFLMPSASASLGTRLLTIVRSQADYVILGLVAREVEVGLYYFAFKLAVQPLRMVAGSLSTVLFPALVQYRDDPARQLGAALVVSRMLSVVVFPACFLQAALAGPVLELLFGPQWKAAEPLVQLLSIGLAFDASSWAAGAFLGARGEFRRGFRYALLAAPTLFVFVAIGAVSYGPIGVAAAVAGFYMLVQPVYCWLVFRRVGAVGWRDIALIYAAPVLLSAASVGIASALAGALWRPAWFALCFVPPVALAIYVSLIRLCCPDTYGHLRQWALRLRARSAAA
jgi:PST family polysaccharide transporter